VENERASKCYRVENAGVEIIAPKRRAGK